MSPQVFIEKHRIKVLAFILLLALLVRLSVFQYVFSDGNITFLGADTYYHARRILFTASHFPDALAFDSYINFPYGTMIGWMPLYDQFTALIALMIGLGKPSTYTIETTTAVIPPLLGVLTTLLVFFIAEKFFDWRVGIISAAIFAITPAHVYISFLGYPDHHVAETLLSTAAYLFFIISMERLQEEKISFSSSANISKNSLFPVLTGAVLALSLFTWNGAPIFVGLIGIFIIVQFLIDQRIGRNSDYLLITGGSAFIVSLFIITPAAITQDRGFGISSYLPSQFHIGFLAVFLLICTLLAGMQRLQFKKWWYHVVLLALVFTAAFYSLKIFLPLLYYSAASGITYLFGGGILATIQEAVPLFINPGEGFTLSNVWRAFTLSFFIAIPSFIFFIRKTIKEKYAVEAVFLIVWTFLVLMLTIFQRRFIYLLAVNIAIFSGYFIIIAAKLFSPEDEKKTIVTKKKQKRKRTSGPAFNKGHAVGLLIFVILSVPDLSVIKYMAMDGISAPDSDLQESFKWIKENTPPTSYYDAPDKPAEYGIMSWWDYGNWILYFSQRPVVANNFQTGLEDAANFLTEPDEIRANQILNKRGVRFVVTDAQMLKLKFNSIAMLAGKNPDDYYGIKDPSEVQIRSVNYENKNFFATMLSRLHVFDGDGLGHYRLIYESKTTAIRSPDIKYVKVFEYVPGATISGKTDGNVKATLNILTNQGRTFTYTQQATVKNGRYELKVPYSTQGSRYGTKPLGDYIIQNSNFSTAISVSEEDVMNGKEIQVDLTT
jgi:oligosaccharyl transferase (archaeosortase A-associated)